MLARGHFDRGELLPQVRFGAADPGEVFIWQLFNEVAINPYVWGKPTDKAALDKTLNEGLPQVLDYLEGQVPAAGNIFGELSIADISIASFFRNAAFARYKVDAARWPKTAAYAERVLAHPGFVKLRTFEDKSARTPIPRHRAALKELGAPLTNDSYATAEPRPGIMRI